MDEPSETDRFKAKLFEKYKPFLINKDVRYKLMKVSKEYGEDMDNLMRELHPSSEATLEGLNSSKEMLEIFVELYLRLNKEPDYCESLSSGEDENPGSNQMDAKNWTMDNPNIRDRPLSYAQNDVQLAPQPTNIAQPVAAQQFIPNMPNYQAMVPLHSNQIQHQTYNQMFQPSMLYSQLPSFGIQYPQVTYNPPSSHLMAPQLAAGLSSVAYLPPRPLRPIFPEFQPSTSNHTYYRPNFNTALTYGEHRRQKEEKERREKRQKEEKERREKRQRELEKQQQQQSELQETQAKKEKPKNISVQKPFLKVQSRPSIKLSNKKDGPIKKTVTFAVKEGRNEPEQVQKKTEEPPKQAPKETPINSLRVIKPPKRKALPKKQPAKRKSKRIKSPVPKRLTKDKSESVQKRELTVKRNVGKRNVKTSEAPPETPRYRTFIVDDIEVKSEIESFVGEGSSDIQDFVKENFPSNENNGTSFVKSEPVLHIHNTSTDSDSTVKIEQDSESEHVGSTASIVNEPVDSDEVNEFAMACEDPEIVKLVVQQQVNVVITEQDQITYDRSKFNLNGVEQMDSESKCEAWLQMMDYDIKEEEEEIISYFPACPPELQLKQELIQN